MYVSNLFIFEIKFIVCMGTAKPRVFIVQENEDANVVLTGTLWEKGFEPFKFTNGTECLVQFNQMGGKVDAIVVSDSIAGDKNLMLITNIKKINGYTKVFVIADEDSGKQGYWAMVRMNLILNQLAQKTLPINF